jgi:hypothetical protein
MADKTAVVCQCFTRQIPYLVCQVGVQRRGRSRQVGELSNEFDVPTRTSMGQSAQRVLGQHASSVGGRDAMRLEAHITALSSSTSSS